MPVSLSFLVPRQWLLACSSTPEEFRHVVRQWTTLLGVSGFAIGSLFVTGCKPKKVEGAPPGPAEVATVTLRPERTVLTTELPERTSAFLVADIRPQVNGLIQNRQFREGSQVKAEELLYQIDPAVYQAAFSRAKAAVTTAKADLVTVEAREQVVRVLSQIAEQGAARGAAPLGRTEAGATALSQAGTRS